MSTQTEITFTSAVIEKIKIGPQTTSLNPEERKLARTLRIQKRLTTVLEASGSGDVGQEEKDTSELYQQKVKSERNLQKLVNKAEKDLNEVLVVNQTNEQSRRNSVKINRQKVIDSLEHEAMNSHKSFNKIIESWRDMEDLTDPVEIHNGIRNIKEKCNALIDERDKIIIALKIDIGKSEKSFNNYQKKNFEDNEILFKRINNHIASMREAFRAQMTIVKNTIETVTNEYINYRYYNWNELYENMVNSTEQVSNTKFRFLKKVSNSVDNLIKSFEEDFRGQKSELLQTVNKSRQALEIVKADVLLHSEKYDYNYQILERRCNESTILGADQKRRITKLQDVVTELKKSIHIYNSDTKRKIKQLTNNIKATQKQILDIEHKADHFAELNDRLFHEIWNLNKTNCQNLLNKIMGTDKILQEQQLAVEWNKPVNLLEMSALPSYKQAVTIVSLIKKVSQAAAPPAPNPHFKAGILTNEDQSTIQYLKSLDAYKKLLKKILVITSDKSGFLTEKRIKSLVGKYNTKDKSLVRLENVLETLHIEKQEDIDLILDFFLPYSYCLTCTGDDQFTEPSLILTGQHMSQVSCMSSYTAKSLIECESLNEDYFPQIFEALMYTTHQRDSIEEAVIQIVTSDVDIKNITQDSVESIDIAKADMMEMSEKRISSSKKKPLASMKEKTLCQYNHSLVISSIYIIRALRNFIEFYCKRPVIIPTMGERMRRKRVTISRLLNDKDILCYWKQWKNLFDDRSDITMIWNGLQKGLQYYLQVLKQRKLLCEEVLKLRKQNKTLKKMVESYTHHKVFLPPICEIQCVCSSDQIKPIYKRKAR